MALLWCYHMYQLLCENKEVPKGCIGWEMRCQNLFCSNLFTKELLHSFSVFPVKLYLTNIFLCNSCRLHQRDSAVPMTHTTSMSTTHKNMAVSRPWTARVVVAGTVVEVAAAVVAVEWEAAGKFTFKIRSSRLSSFHTLIYTSCWIKIVSVTCVTPIFQLTVLSPFCLFIIRFML